MSEPQLSRNYRGYSPAPVSWEALLRIFNGLWGPEARSLKRFPEDLNNIYVRWSDADGAVHQVESLEDLNEAYTAERTATISFSGFMPDTRSCTFLYRPGADPPVAEVSLQAPRSLAEAMVNSVAAEFPNQRDIVFMSWSGDRARRIAERLSEILVSRLPKTTIVFLSSNIEPGSHPYDEMLMQHLRPCVALVSIWTQDGVENPAWMAWEASAAWARDALLIPVFAGVLADSVPGPLFVIRQGVHLDRRDELDRALVTLGRRLKTKEVESLSDADHASLTALLHMGSP